MNGVSRETFEGYDTNSKLNTIFDYMKELHQCQGETAKAVQDFKERYEKRKRFDTATGAGAGLIGGFFAALGIKWWS